MFTNNRIEEDVRAALRHNPRINHPELTAVSVDLKLHPSVARRRTDDELRAAALRRLIGDARIRSTHIHVKVAHGHLTLTGYVREEAESDAAGEDVATVTGVDGITNRLEIR
jgi:osmotically-inducible protein OsmY